VVQPAFRGLVGHVERLGKVLAQIVAGARLERLVVLHQGFTGIGAHRAGKPLRVALPPGEHRHRHPRLHEGPVDPENPERLLLGLGLAGMGRVAFLPEKLGGSQKQPGPELPADHVGPLVQQHREIPVALDPLRQHRVDDRFGGGTHDQRLLQQLAAPMGHHGGFGGKSLDVFRFLRQKTLGNEEREIRVLMPGVLEHPVEATLHLLPDGIPVGTDHHAPAHRTVIGEFGAQHEFVVPGVEVLRPGSQTFVSHRGPSAFCGRWRKP